MLKEVPPADAEEGVLEGQAEDAVGEAQAAPGTLAARPPQSLAEAAVVILVVVLQEELEVAAVERVAVARSFSFTFTSPRQNSPVRL